VAYFLWERSKRPKWEVISVNAEKRTVTVKVNNKIHELGLDPAMALNLKYGFAIEVQKQRENSYYVVLTKDGAINDSPVLLDI